MKTEKIKKFRIIDKEYLPENVVAIEVDERDDGYFMIRHIYDRDGFSTRDMISKDKLRLHAAIWELIK